MNNQESKSHRKITHERWCKEGFKQWTTIEFLFESNFSSFYFFLFGFHFSFPLCRCFWFVVSEFTHYSFENFVTLIAVIAIAFHASASSFQIFLDIIGFWLIHCLEAKLRTKRRQYAKTLDFDWFLGKNWNSSRNLSRIFQCMNSVRLS